MLALLSMSLALLSAPQLSSRRVVCIGAAFALPACAAAATLDPVNELQQGLIVLDDVIQRWPELTTDCRYGELKREILSAANKDALLKAASQTDKAETMVVMCKSTGRLVREALGADISSPLHNVGRLLERPALVQRVDYDDLEAFQSASEKLQQSLSAADAAAFFAATADLSAQNTFKKGEVPVTPNLDAARQSIAEARSAMAVLCKLLAP